LRFSTIDRSGRGPSFHVLNDVSEEDLLALERAGEMAEWEERVMGVHWAMAEQKTGPFFFFDEVEG
jgi:hypothetical protein